MKKTSLLLLTLLLLGGCYRLSVQSFMQAPVMLNGPQILEGTTYSVRKRFYREIQLEYIFGLNEQEHLQINRILQEEAAPDGGIINLKIQRTYRFLDVLVGLFTLGVYSRALIIVEGDVVVWH